MSKSYPASRAVLGAVLALPFIGRTPQSPSRLWVLAPVLAITVVLIYTGYAGQSASKRLDGIKPLASDRPADGEWKVWGHTLSGQRFSALGDIDTGNVANMKLAWTYESDVEPFGYHGFEATPLAADGKLFVCLDRDVIVSLDQETGKEIAEDENGGEEE